MDAGRAALQELQALVDCMLHSGGKNFLRIASNRIEPIEKPGGKPRSAHSREFLNLVDVCDRHDSRNDRHLYSGGTASFHEFEVSRIIKEKLAYEHINASRDLFPEVSNVGFGGLRLWVSLGVAGSENARVRVPFADRADEVDGVSATGRDRRRVAWLVAAQGEDVGQASGADIVDREFEVGSGLAKAGEMNDRVDSVVAIDAFRIRNGFALLASARSAGHAHKRWSESLELGNGEKQTFFACLGFRREEFKRKCGRTWRNQVNYSHSVAAMLPRGG